MSALGAVKIRQKGIIIKFEGYALPLIRIVCICYVCLNQSLSLYFSIKSRVLSNNLDCFYFSNQCIGGGGGDVHIHKMAEEALIRFNINRLIEGRAAL